jgi:hypothetical protein
MINISNYENCELKAGVILIGRLSFLEDASGIVENLCLQLPEVFAEANNLYLKLFVFPVVFQVA